MARTPMQLDEPSPVSRSFTILWVVLAAAYLVTAIAVSQLPPDPLLEIPGVALAHSVAMALVGLVTAILLFAHATRAGNRGYLLLAGVFTCVVILVLALPLAFPGALVMADDGSPKRLLGGLQSSITLFYQWHLVLYVGLPVAAVLITSVARKSRRPLSAAEVTGSVAVSVGAGLVLVLWNFLAPDSLPILIGDNGINGLAKSLDWILLGIAIVGLIVIVVVTRERSVISRWITAVAVLSVGEAIVNVGVERYSAGWYFTRVFGLFAMSALLLALVWEMARVDRIALTVASRDTLTSAQSRALFETELAREVTRAINTGEKLALLWIDIDDFKSVNDRFGHSSGDHVLKVVAARIRAEIRNTDLLARMGGDEFAVALPGIGSRSVAETVAARIVADLAMPFEVAESSVFVSCSVGLAYAPDDARAADDLSHLADIAMYEAKSQGGNRFASHSQGQEDHAREIAELRSALLEGVRDQAFAPYAQPVVDPSSGRVVGLEILARWLRDGEVVPAVDFIDLAESSGIVIQIGRLVRAATLEHISHVFARHADLDFVTVNLSVSELRHKAAVDDLCGPAWAPWASRTVLELTESAALNDAGPATDAISSLRQAGFRFAVDDFGAGFSTMVRLEQLHPYLIKSDRSLLARTHADVPAPDAMVRWAHEISRALGSRLIVEGVETADEDALVRTLDGALGQGYFYAGPTPLTEWR